MRAADMLDVVHYLLEEDVFRVLPAAESPTKAMTDIRQSIYKNLYGRDYQNETSDTERTAEPSAPRTTVSRPVKAYVPPTDYESLSGLVGDPLG